MNDSAPACTIPEPDGGNSAIVDLIIYTCITISKYSEP